MESIEHTGTLFRWQGGEGGNWYFIAIDGAAGEALSATRLMRRLESGSARGFGMIKVTVRIGGSRWQTSAFPQKSGGWLLPVKAAIRRAEGLGEGDQVWVVLEF